MTSQERVDLQYSISIREIITAIISLQGTIAIAAPQRRRESPAAAAAAAEKAEMNPQADEDGDDDDVSRVGNRVAAAASLLLLRGGGGGRIADNDDGVDGRVGYVDGSSAEQEGAGDPDEDDSDDDSDDEHLYDDLPDLIDGDGNVVLYSCNPQAGERRDDSHVGTPRTWGQPSPGDARLSPTL